MKVPLNQNQVQRKSISVDPIKTSVIGTSAMGSDVFEATQRLGNAVGDVAKVATDYGIRLDQEDRKKRVYDATMKAQQELDDGLYSGDLDENNQPKGLFNRNGENARGVTVSYDEFSNGVVSKYGNELDEKDRETFMQSIGTHVLSMRNSMAKHEARENQASFENKRKSYIDMRVGRAANLTDDTELSAELLGALKDNDESLSLKGLDSNTRTIENQKLTDRMIQVNIESKLETAPDAAKETLETFKDKMSPEFYQKANKLVEGKRFDNLRLNLWDNQFSKMKMSDGNVDLARVQKTINSSSFTNEQKVQLYGFAEAQAGNLRMQKTQKEAALTDAFQNELVKAKSQGVDLNQALKLAGQFGSDDYDRSQKEDAVKKYYTTSFKTSPDTYMRFYEGVKDGSIQKEEIDKARQNGSLSVDDWTEFRKSLFNSEITGESGNKGFDRIKLLAEENFSSSKKEEKNIFLYEVRQATKGMTNEQAITYAKEALNDVVVSKGFLWDSTKPKYEVDFNKRDANSEAWGMIQNDIGSKELQAIGQGLQFKTSKKSLGISDIDTFANSLGGYESIKSGTPSHSAIQSLIKNNKPVTADNVKAILQRYPDGKYNGKPN